VGVEVQALGKSPLEKDLQRVVLGLAVILTVESPLICGNARSSRFFWMVEAVKNPSVDICW
jgi:hypothetical protein